MATNIILRPVYNRPEMFYLSLEYEIEARKYYMLPDNFITVFLVEYGSPKKIYDLIENYPFKSSCILRQRKFGLTVNILEGMKEVFNLADRYIIYIEDDILLHKTYFQYIDILLNMENLGRFSVLSPYSPNDTGAVNEVRRTHIYAALAPLINKEFYLNYIYPCSNLNYYNNMALFVSELNEKYKDYWKSRRYKYTDVAHYEQAGIINRLVDVAMIDDEMYVIVPKVNRQIHIGFLGKNRSGFLPGKGFEERLANLREIIKDPNEMYKHTNSKQYNDYKIFSPKLDEWDGTVVFK
jgi:hypothetical protein